jgi:ureidoglycolate dehydrogenase (NAD+)
VPNFDAKILSKIMRETLLTRGVVPESAAHVASSLIQTSLRGVDSHGINVFPHYCRAIEAGRINKNPRMKTSKPSNTVAVIDADHAFGHHAGAEAVDASVEMAKEAGIGAVGVRNSTHFGAAAYFGLRAAARDCIGFAFTNADALVKAFGAKEVFFGTNPICFTAPMESEEPFCLDMATSLVSWNKIKIYRSQNKKLPSHWAFDDAGASVTDPNRARSLNPIGDYKGFGLGMMVDILCAVLLGGPIGKDIGPMYERLDDSKRRIGHFFMAIDISKFIDPILFKKNLQNVADRIRGLPPLDKGGKVLVAGDPEKMAFAERTEEGIPVDDAKAGEFFELSTHFKKALIS